jgi:hypothetical protein
MHADFSVELGRDDAALELPWSSTDPAVRFYDVKNHPELLQQIPEAMAFPELAAFLARINAAGFPLATAKCDAWRSREVAKEEEIYGDRKVVSYVDLVFEGKAERCSFETHEAFAKDLCRLLGQAPEIPAAMEVVIRRCYYHGALAEVAASGAVAEEVHKIESRDEAETRNAADAGSEVESVRPGVGRDATDAGDRVETGEALEVNDAADARDVEERQSGAANREGTDRVDASERPPQQADIGHGMKYEGHADADQRAEADIGEAEAAERLDVTAADEGVGASGLDGSISGFCFTAYVTGFGDSDHEPRLRWQIALALLQNALVQLAETEAGGTDG